GRDVVPMLAAVAGDPDVAVVGASPDRVHILERRPDAVDHAAVVTRVHLGVERCQARRLARIRTRQVRTDLVPGLTAIAGLEQHVGAVEQHVRIGRREQQRRRAVGAVLTATPDLRTDELGLPGDAVVPGDLAAIDDVGVERIGRDVAVLLDAHRVPIAQRDLPVIAAAGDADRAAFLLRGVDVVGEFVVGDDVVRRRGRLVVPGAPGLAAVDAQGAALVHAERDDLRVFRIDPDAVVVVAARRALDRLEGLAGVQRAIERRVGDVDLVGVVRRHRDLGKVLPAAVDARLIVDALEALARVVGTIRASKGRRRLHLRINALGVAGRDADADAAQALRHRGQALANLLPGRAVIGGLEQAAARHAIERTLARPRRMPRGPQ